MDGRSRRAVVLKGQQDGGRATGKAEPLTRALRGTVVALVRQDGPDLTARQLGVLLTVCLVDGPHTVRGLAAELNITKVAITRALDRLTTLDLVRRQDDPRDRRSVLAVPTAAGRGFVAELRRTMSKEARLAWPAADDWRTAA